MTFSLSKKPLTAKEIQKSDEEFEASADGKAMAQKLGKLIHEMGIQLPSDEERATREAYTRRISKELILREVEILHKAYQKYENAFFAWEARKLCCESGAMVPEWVSDYLDTVSNALVNLDPENTEQQKGVSCALGIRTKQGKGGDLWKFKDYKNNLQIYILVERIKAKDILDHGSAKMRLIYEQVKDGLGLTISVDTIRRIHREFSES